MALIKCIECGHEVSDKALACPNCGYPINEMEKSNENVQEENNAIKPLTEFEISVLKDARIFYGKHRNLYELKKYLKEKYELNDEDVLKYAKRAKTSFDIFIAMIILLVIIVLGSICISQYKQKKANREIEEFNEKIGQTYARTSWYYMTGDEDTFEYTKITFINNKKVQYNTAVKKSSDAKVLISNKEYEYKDKDDYFIIKMDKGDMKCTKSKKATSLKCNKLGNMKRSCTMRLPNFDVEKGDKYTWKDTLNITGKAFVKYDYGIQKTDEIYYFKPFGVVQQHLYNDIKMNSLTDYEYEKNEHHYNFEWWEDDGEIYLSVIQQCHAYELKKEGDITDNPTIFTYDKNVNQITSSYNTYNNIKVKTIPTEYSVYGEIQEGMAIENVEPKNITFFSDNLNLDIIKNVLTSVDINGEITDAVFLTSNGEKNTGYSARSWSAYYTGNTSNYNLYYVLDGNFQMTFAKKESKVFENVPIKIVGFDEKKYKARIINNKKLSITVTGAQKNLDNLKKETVKAVANLNYMEPGRAKVVVMASCGSDAFNNFFVGLVDCKMDEEYIEIELKNK